MKKIVSIALMVALALLLLTACSSGSATAPAVSEPSAGEASGSFDPSQLKTMGELFASAEVEEAQTGFSEAHYVVVFHAGGNDYRAVADMPQDVSDAVWAIDFFDEERDQKIQDLVSPLAIGSLENLTEQAPSQEALDAYVGKTGQDLFDEGWSYWFYDLEAMEAGFYSGPFSYMVQFEYDGEPLENDDDFDFYETFKDLKIRSVTYEGLGDAADIGE